ncbi:MAG: DUF2523 domain-containing protein [Lautropia sp.]|nr:DUF2523 domain-containing protein [Lautropia sp.]
MQGFAAWMLALAAPVAIKALAALGIGAVTYVGADAALHGLLDQVQAAMGGISGELAGVLGLAGLYQAVSIVSGGMVSALAWSQLTRLGLLTGTGGKR